LSGRGWKRRLAVPIVLPAGGKIETLDDARQYLLRIPKAKYTDDMGEAADALVKVANGEWDMMLANGWIARVVYGPRKHRAPTGLRSKPAKVYKILRSSPAPRRV
jgi:hypothetical protein